MNALFCPFCQRFDADFTEIREEGTRKIWHALQCPTCKATGPHAVTREQALIGWHMREGVPMQIPGGCGANYVAADNVP